jgi:hypothetical protein
MHMFFKYGIFRNDSSFDILDQQLEYTRFNPHLFVHCTFTVKKQFVGTSHFFLMACRKITRPYRSWLL